MSPSRSSRATRSASNGGGSSTTVPAAAALRTSTISPPTCDSGIGTSQRSSGSEPSTAPAARTCAARLPKVSSTGRGVRVVPEVWTTSASSSSPGSTMLNGAPPSSTSGCVTSTSAPRASSARSRSDSRRSIGMAGARSSRQPWTVATNARPGGSAIPTRSPGRAPRSTSRARRARRGQQQLVVGEPLLGRLERDAVGTARGGAGEPGTDFHRTRLMSSACPSNGPRPGSTQTSATRWPRGSPRSPSTAPRCATRSAPRR